MRRRKWSLRLGGEPPPLRLGLLATLAAVAASTLIVYLLKPVSPVVSLGVVYLPAILAISIFWGLRLGLLASLASVVAFNFFHIPPLHRFTIGSDENWVALAIFAIVAVGSSALAGLAREQALEAQPARTVQLPDFARGRAAKAAHRLAVRLAQADTHVPDVHHRHKH